MRYLEVPHVEWNDISRKSDWLNWGCRLPKAPRLSIGIGSEGWGAAFGPWADCGTFCGLNSLSAKLRVVFELSLGLSSNCQIVIAPTMVVLPISVRLVQARPQELGPLPQPVEEQEPGQLLVGLVQTALTINSGTAIKHFVRTSIVVSIWQWAVDLSGPKKPIWAVSPGLEHSDETVCKNVFKFWDGERLNRKLVRNFLTAEVTNSEKVRKQNPFRNSSKVLVEPKYPTVLNFWRRKTIFLHKI